MSLFDASTSSGGSVNSAKGYSISQGSSNSQTYGTLATERSKYLAQLANIQSAQAWNNTAQYNSDQAAINRAWQEYMANTVYQRTVKDMKSAGINPILAAGMGLGTASVGSGATASMTNPEIFMGNSIADQTSASQNQSYSENESHGSSWQNSESGLATFLTSMDTWINGLINAMNAGKTINIALNGLEDSGITKTSSGKWIDKTTKKITEEVVNNTNHKGLMGILEKFGKGALQYEGYNVNK